MNIDLIGRMDRGNSASQERKVVRLTLGGIQCAIDIMRVREIIVPKDVQTVFNSSAHLIGITDHRDSALPVIDLRQKMHANITDRAKEKWVIVAANSRDIALVVDSVEGVVTVGPQNMRSKDAIGEHGNLAMTRNVFSIADGLLLELDLDNIKVDDRSVESLPEAP